tara:strand:- start:554 stop:889 length:336 start_codon:yes stop_codon:yes gene_type:complete
MILKKLKRALQARTIFTHEEILSLFLEHGKAIIPRLPFLWPEFLGPSYIKENKRSMALYNKINAKHPGLILFHAANSNKYTEYELGPTQAKEILDGISRSRKADRIRSRRY